VSRQSLCWDSQASLSVLSDILYNDAGSVVMNNVLEDDTRYRGVAVALRNTESVRPRKVNVNLTVGISGEN
jgi:hypothetical protein